MGCCCSGEFADTFRQVHAADEVVHRRPLALGRLVPLVLAVERLEGVAPHVLLQDAAVS